MGEVVAGIIVESDSIGSIAPGLLNENSEMQITDIESIILQHDMENELGFAQGYYDKRSAHLVKVHTSEGVTGIGEVFGAGNFLAFDRKTE
jgi:hypothetical protein